MSHLLQLGLLHHNTRVHGAGRQQGRSCQADKASLIQPRSCFVGKAGGQCRPGQNGVACIPECQAATAALTARAPTNHIGNTIQQWPSLPFSWQHTRTARLLEGAEALAPLAANARLVEKVAAIVLESVRIIGSGKGSFQCAGRDLCCGDPAAPEMPAGLPLTLPTVAH